MANSKDVQRDDERRTLIQLALGKASVAFMRQSADVVMPTEELLEVSEDIHAVWALEVDNLAAEVRELREKVAELESDHEWIAERCAACGHRFAYPSNVCARCNTKVGSTEPDAYPELCECPRCIVARNVAMDAKREGEA